MSPQTEKKINFVLPELAYSTDAFEPYIDQRTMEIHHGKHHAGYVNKLNEAQIPVRHLSLKDILISVSKFETVVRNNAGGHYNHSLFWQILSPVPVQEPNGLLIDGINNRFGSFESFKDAFTKAAMSVFGSGWAWLVVRNNKLEIGTTPNQDNPLMDLSPFKGIPVFGIDVWEHAYYLKYQNNRLEYINNFWNIVDWDEVNRRYNEALYVDEMQEISY